MASPHTSEAGFLVLHGLKLKGFALPPVLADLTGLGSDDVVAHLEAHREAGLVQYREGRISGWSLPTAVGRIRHADGCTADLDHSGRRDVVDRVYAQFARINQPFLSVCTDWQLTARGGAQAVNDHSDAAYDAEVIGRLGEIHDAVTPLCSELGEALARFGPYQERFSEAVARVRAGEHEWFTGALIESYHTVWFELHEDLLTTLGIPRAQEVAR